MLSPFILIDTSIDVASATLGCKLVSPSRLLALEGRTQLPQVLAVLVEHCLKLLQLFELDSLVAL